MNYILCYQCLLPYSNNAGYIRYKWRENVSLATGEETLAINGEAVLLLLMPTLTGYW